MAQRTAKKSPARPGAKGDGAKGSVTLKALRVIPAFATMAEDDAAQFLSLMKERTATEGEPIFREGEVGSGLYVILDGSISIHKKNAKGGDREVAALDRNEVFGEMDLISDRLHTSGAKCRTACRMLFLPRKAFQDLLRKGNPGAAAMVVYFARMLAGRLESSNKRMLEILDGQAKAPGSTEFAEFKRRLLKEWSF